MDNEQLLHLALAEAKAAGADYAEGRAEDNRSERIVTRNHSVERLIRSEDSGWGVHAYAGGGWGFASTYSNRTDAVPEVARKAVELARAAGSLSRSASDLSAMTRETGSYTTNLTTDPFGIALEARTTYLLKATAGILAASDRVKVATGTLLAQRIGRVYANTRGARLQQYIIYSGAWLSAFASFEGYSYRRTFGDMSQAGWEFIDRLDLNSAATRIGEEAGELVAAPWAPAGPRTVVLSSDMIALMVHESCGHPTELDRVLGWEAAFAGTSFLMPDMLDKFKYGSEKVNMTADSILEGGLGTFGWDDEGTPAQRSPIIRDGIFKGYLSSRESARLLGRVSNGCGRATSWGRIPLVRMVNLSLEPGEGTLDDVISGVDDGLYVETPSSWSLDDKRMNFHFSAELCREIKGGKLGQLMKGASYQGRTPEFWGSVDAIGGESEWKLWGFPHCAKGEPLQLCPVSHGASPVLVHGLQMSEGAR